MQKRLAALFVLSCIALTGCNSTFENPTSLNLLHEHFNVPGSVGTLSGYPAAPIPHHHPSPRPVGSSPADPRHQDSHHLPHHSS